jgi:DNA sulfur modification protein DndB
MEPKSKEIFLPALRGRMGDWVYYAAIMKLKDIKDRVHYAEDIHKSIRLQELIQRSLTSRDKDIAQYLLEQPQRFFNSLIVGLYEGEPQWIELDVHPHHILPEFPLSEQGILGFLKLSGEERLFALDGQHRLAGIRGALENQGPGSPLFNEEVSVIFIGHKETAEGMERTRRLFTTLNRYAKPVTLSEIIALDEDDMCAIVTRDLLDKHKLFRNSRLSLSTSNSIPTSDQESFTNIVFLYKCVSVLLKAYFLKRKNISSKKWKSFLKRRPSQDEIDEAFNFIVYLWDKAIGFLSPMREYLKKEESEKLKAKNFRNENGCCILFRPIGLLIFMEAIAACIEESDNEVEKTVERTLPLLSKVEMNIDKFPWQGLLWESGEKRMITAPENRNVAKRLLLYMIGFNLEKIKITEATLKKSYASLLNKKPEEIDLPKRIF